MTDPIQHLRDMQAKLARWDGIAMTGDMAEEYDAEVEEYRKAVDRTLPALLAVDEAARKLSRQVTDDGTLHEQGLLDEVRETLAKLDEVKPS